MAAAGTNAALLQWAETVKGSLQKARTPMEGLWRDIRDNFEPKLGRALDDGRDLNVDASKRGDEKIINSKPRDLVSRLSSGLQSGITNQARQWFRLVEKGTPREKMGAQKRKAIDSATELLQGTIAGSNAYTSLISLYMRLGQFGTACGLLLPDEETVVRLDVLDEGAYWIGQDRRGRVCTLLRRVEWTVRQLVEEFDGEDLPDSVRRDYDEGRTEEFRRGWNLVTPVREVPKGLRGAFGHQPFASIYWLETESGPDAVLARRGFWYNPVIAPRWSVPTGSAYGLGLGEKALPDAKELQSLELSKLKIVAAEADPPMAAPESMRGTGVNLNPGAINYFNAGTGGQSPGHIPVQPIDQRQKRLDEVLATVHDVEQRLGRLFFEDLFAMLLQIQMGEGKRQMTATEVTELSSEKIALLGPILTRLNGDLLNPLVDGVYAICMEDAERKMEDASAREMMYGFADESDAESIARYQPLLDIMGMDLDVEYSSTLHLDQLSNSRMTGVLKTIEYVGMLAQYDPTVMDNLDLDQAARIAARSFMEFGIIRDEKDVETIREGRAAQQEQQMRMQQAQMQMQQQESQAAVAAQQAKMLKDLQEAQRAAGGDAYAPQAAGIGGLA